MGDGGWESLLTCWEVLTCSSNPISREPSAVGASYNYASKLICRWDIALTKVEEPASSFVAVISAAMIRMCNNKIRRKQHKNNNLYM